jgi:spoIIIJ-associated protein
MPKIYEAKTLEDAYELASSSLQCSVIDLHIEIIQHPSNGLFGFFSKKAIIKAKAKNKRYSESKKENLSEDINVTSLSSKLDTIDTEDKSGNNTTEQIKGAAIFEDFYASKEEKHHEKPKIKEVQEPADSVQKEIEEKINELFSHICYDIEPIKVEILKGENTVYIEFSGNDSALLIGKEGYRYKALSYILFNWINEKYGMMLKLEVASFLANQIESIHAYLGPVIETIKEEGFYKTKTLDGILVHIALTKLREEFPNKYVAVKTNQNGEKYILINEYKNY